VRSLFGRLRTPTAAALAAAALLAIAGVVLVLLGLMKATVWAPERTTMARVAGQPGAPVVTTTPAATALDGPALKVDVRGPAGRPAFVGVGRADDVAAYLGAVARTEVTGVRDGRGVVQRQGAEASLPQPAGVDVWAASATGSGSASLTWPQSPGRWQVVAAVDGATPPTEVVLTWQRARVSSSAPALLAVGGLLLALGLVGGWAARRTRPAPSTATSAATAGSTARPAGSGTPPAPAPTPAGAPSAPVAPVPAAVRTAPARPAGAPARPADAPARPAPAPGSRRAARAAATGDLPAVGAGAGVPRRAPGPWYDDPDEPEDDVAPAPFRQPPGGRS
jgi:hypothetical protein